MIGVRQYLVPCRRLSIRVPADNTCLMFPGKKTKERCIVRSVRLLRGLLAAPRGRGPVVRAAGGPARAPAVARCSALVL